MGFAVGVVGFQDDAVRAAGCCSLKLELERDIASLVAADLLPVNPGSGLPVGCSHNEEYPFAFPRLRYGDFPSVPCYVAFVFDFGELRPPRERDQDFLVHRSEVVPCDCGLGCGFIEGECPVAVEVHPCRPFEIRTRMLRQRDAFFYVCGIAGAEQEGCHGADECGFCSHIRVSVYFLVVALLVEFQ